MKKKTNVTTLKLKRILAEKEAEYQGKDDIFGMTLLTNPGYISSSRNVMFTSHLKQFVNMLKPEVPRVFTNYENTVGKYSTGYYKSKTTKIVVDKIYKYEDIENIPEEFQTYLLFLYDEENDKYEVIEKKVVEDLTEMFGFKYNNENIDSKKIGDVVKKDEVLFKTTSYDDDMNYCYGRNTKFAYMLHNNTIEDAIVVSESLEKSMKSIETETVKISLNDNDIFCNIYGDKEQYKCFPDIGESIKDKMVCVTRRLHNNQLLYHLKSSNLRNIDFSSDVPYFNNGKIVDIKVYCNKTREEMLDNQFNRQILKYLDQQTSYNQKINDRCLQIIESGSKYSDDISFLYKKSLDTLDPNYKWKEDDNSVFSNIKIEFLVAREVGLSVGQKITGRYGNKGVISKIVPDEEMPFLETGERIDVIFNTLGVINRVNSFQLIEQSITFTSNRTVERMKTLNNNSERSELLFKYISFFNETESTKLKEYYDELNSSEQDKFFDSIYTNGIYIHIPPMWEDETLFDRFTRLYEEFDWIQPYDVYMNKFGRTIKILKKLVIGDMYVLKLKQTSKKGFSVRATGGLSKRGTPEKSNKARDNQDLYSKTPIRIGDQENINALIGVNSKTMADLHLFYRSSVFGRKYLGTELATNVEELEKFESSSTFTNRNVEILNAYLKSMGLRMSFSDQYLNIDVKTKEISDHTINGDIYICDDYEFEDYKRERSIRDIFENEECFIGSNEEYESMISQYSNVIKDIDDGIHINIDMD